MRALTTSEKVILGFSATTASLSLSLIILLAVRLQYNVSSAKGTTPQFIFETPSDTTTLDPTSSTATTNPITINYSSDGAALYTIALFFFIFAFAGADLIIEKNWEVKGIS